MKYRTAKRFIMRNQWTLAKIKEIGSHIAPPSFHKRMRNVIARLLKEK